MRFLSSFTAVAALLSCIQALDFGEAEDYAVLAGAAIISSKNAGTEITGDIGVYPGKTINGFPPAVLNGDKHSGDDNAKEAQRDLTIAYDELAALPSDTNLTGQDMGGMTLLPGVYKFDTTCDLTGNLTLDAMGNAAANWTFQVQAALKIADGSYVLFKNNTGNTANVYWQAGASISIGAGASVVGNFLGKASINVDNGATIKGRCMTQSASIKLDNNVITRPSMVGLSAEQTINGISLEQFNNHSALNTATLKKAISRTMPSTTPANVLNFKARAGPTSAATTTTRILSTSSIILNYDVIVPSTETSEQLQDQLRNAVYDGTFNTYLQEEVAQSGATDLEGASSDTISTRNINGNNGKSEDTLSDGAIAGIVIGCFFGLVLIAALIFFFVCYHPASATSTGASTQKSTTVTTQEV